MASKSSTMEPEKALQTIDHERVAELAHRIYLARGAGDGHDLDVGVIMLNRLTGSPHDC